MASKGKAPMTPGLAIHFTLQGLPKLLNASSGSHYRAVAAERRKWKLLVKQITLGQVPPEPWRRAEVTVTRYSARCPDYDGLVSGAKSVIDGLTEAGIILDDSMHHIGMPQFRWAKAKPGEGRVEVQVDRLPDDAQLFSF